MIKSLTVFLFLGASCLAWSSQPKKPDSFSVAVDSIPGATRWKVQPLNPKHVEFKILEEGGQAFLEVHYRGQKIFTDETFELLYEVEKGVLESAIGSFFDWDIIGGGSVGEWKKVPFLEGDIRTNDLKALANKAMGEAECPVFFIPQGFGDLYGNTSTLSGGASAEAINRSNIKNTFESFSSDFIRTKGSWKASGYSFDDSSLTIEQIEASVCEN